MKELAKNYNPAEFEDRIYGEWCEKGYFKPDKDEKKQRAGGSHHARDRG